MISWPLKISFIFRFLVRIWYETERHENYKGDCGQVERAEGWELWNLHFCSVMPLSWHVNLEWSLSFYGPISLLESNRINLIISQVSFSLSILRLAIIIYSRCTYMLCQERNFFWGVPSLLFGPSPYCSPSGYN